MNNSFPSPENLADELHKLRTARDEEITLGNATALDIPINNSTCRLYRVSRLTYEKDFPRQEAFENVVASINNVRCRLVYYLRGTGDGVEFYVGVVNMGVDDRLNIGDYGNMLSRAFKGNFLGSQLDELKEEETRSLLAELRQPHMEFSTLLGVPTRNSQREDIAFQGVDRLVNIMTSGGKSLGHSFHLLVLWEPVAAQDVARIEAEAKNLYSLLSVEAKRNVQRGTQTSQQEGETIQDSYYSEGENDGKSQTTAHGVTWGKSDSGSYSSKSTGGSKNTSDTTSDGTSKQKTHSTGTSKATTRTESDNLSWEEQNKFVQDAMEHIKDELQPRIRRGKAKGMYKTSVYVGAATPLDRSLLENALLSICQGDKPVFTPLYARPLPRTEAAYALVSSLNIRDHLDTDVSLLLLDSRPVVRGRVSLGTWLTAAEISMLAGMPQKEVPGLELREQVSFGLNIAPPGSGDALELGHMMQEGSHLEKRRGSLDRQELSKHVFIAGTTGSGKTTTCHKLLASSASTGQALPFLVIEPAKTEYRALLRDQRLADTIIFTVGNEKGVPFRFNPFEFLPTESLSGHVDLLKACFIASFDMEAAIPNLLEEGMYRAYEAYGWDFRDDSNRYLENRLDAWNCGGRYFPTISSYIDITIGLVDEKGFDERLQNDYKGSIRGRLDSLRAGAKGLMLDTPLSVDFMELIDKKVILELEELKSGEDKSFLMGLVLGRMVEALKARHRENPSFRHITLLEDAHRLLTRPMPGDSPNRKLGVETFTDLLAEVRKYGESLIIVDQIPNKLAPEVLKNTNTKIIHKLFARDDKDVVGDTMALDDKQKPYLSHLAPGEAVMFSQGWKKPVNVQVEPLDVKTGDADVPQDQVNAAGWTYWLQRPHLFCPGIPADMAEALIREELLRTVRLKKNFWTLLLDKQGRDWREAWRELRKALNGRTDELLLTLLAAWDMLVPCPDAAEHRRTMQEKLPRLVRQFDNPPADGWLKPADNVSKRIF